MADDISEIYVLIGNEAHVDEIKSHDVVILSCSRAQISDGESGRAVADKLVKLASKIADLTGLDVYVLDIPPTRARPGQALLCNMRLAENIKQIPGVIHLPLTKMAGINKSVTVADNNTLTPDGAKALAEALNHTDQRNKKNAQK